MDKTPRRMLSPEENALLLEFTSKISKLAAREGLSYQLALTGFVTLAVATARYVGLDEDSLLDVIRASWRSR